MAAAEYQHAGDGGLSLGTARDRTVRIMTLPVQNSQEGSERQGLSVRSPRDASGPPLSGADQGGFCI